MLNGWESSTLDQLAEVIDSRHKTPQYSKEGLPMVRVVDVTGGKLELSNTNKVSQEIYDDFSKGRDPEIGDLVISRVGSYGNICYVNSEDKFCLGQNTALIVPKSINWRYLYYQLISPNIKSQIEFLVVGAVQKTISLKSIKSLELLYPPLSEQKAIAHILGTLDEKIELNRKMNQTLEAMAQALFKSWFVDFDPVLDNALTAGNKIPEELQARAEKRKGLSDSKNLLSTNPRLAAQFPDSFVFNERLGKWIPEGWEDVEVGDILERLKISNRYKKDQVKEFGKVPVYEQGADILLGYHENKPDVDASINHPAFIFGDHTCVMKLGISPFSISANVIVLKGNARNTIWTYFGLQGVQSFEEYRRHWMELIVKSIILPPVDLCDKFQELIKPYILQKFETQKQIETLTQLRNTLLPELISGRVKVKLNAFN